MEDRLLRLSDIIRVKGSEKEPMVPVSRSTWYAKVKEGKYPQPIKLGPRTTCWRESEIKKLILYGEDWKNH